MPDPSQWQLSSPPTSLPPSMQSQVSKGMATSGAGALPARVGLTPRLHWGSVPYRHIPWPRTGKGLAGPEPGAGPRWTPYTQRDLEKGTIESPQGGPQEPCSLNAVFTGQAYKIILTSPSWKAGEIQKHTSLKTPNQDVDVCFSSQDWGESLRYFISAESEKNLLSEKRKSVWTSQPSTNLLLLSQNAGIGDWGLECRVLLHSFHWVMTESDSFASASMIFLFCFVILKD